MPPIVKCAACGGRTVAETMRGTEHRICVACGYCSVCDTADGLVEAVHDIAGPTVGPKP